VPLGESRALYRIAETRKLIADALAGDLLRKRAMFLGSKSLRQREAGIGAEKPLEMRKDLKEAGARATDGQ
jgi:hypothetical protein